jgi:hypothetical protein
VRHGRFHRTAIGVAEDDDERRLKLRNRIFDAALDRHTSTVNHVACHADDKQVAYAHVEQ